MPSVILAHICYHCVVVSSMPSVFIIILLHHSLDAQRYFIKNIAWPYDCLSFIILQENCSSAPISCMPSVILALIFTQFASFSICFA